MSSIFKSSYRNFFIISIFIYIITSFFSKGFLYPDEHFQILEFANYKLGNSQSIDLPWEFNEEIRSALQPTIAWLFIKFLSFACINNPFTQALILRLFAALLSWFVVAKISLLLINNFKSEIGKKIFLFLSMFLWFLPLISVRFSSENFSAITFLGALYLILRKTEDNSYKRYIPFAFAGLLLGLSFFFRFQIAFAILGLLLWFVFIQKSNWKNLLVLFLFSLISIVFCVYLDYWFYGKWTFTAWNYLSFYYDQNIVNNISSFGNDPWWYYFYSFIITTIPPISIFLLLFFFFGVFKQSKNIFVWSMIPFIIIHFFIGHKELRFFFPMAFCFVYISALGIDAFIKTQKFQKFARIVFFICVIINFPLLILKMLTPAQEAINYYKFLYDYSDKKEISILCIEKNVYDLGLNVNFYKSPHVKCIVLKNYQEISNYLNNTKPESIYIFEKKISSENAFAGYQKENIYCLYPKWILGIDFNNWQSRARIWNINQLKKIN